MMKRGQEEIVGFIMIVVLVVVILLIFLGLNIRSGDSPTLQDSVKARQFLESSMEFTTDCAIGYIPAYARIGEVIRECSRGGRCVDGRNSCEVLNTSISGLVDAGFNIGEDNPIKGFRFRSYYSSNSSNSEEDIIEMSRGQCNNSLTGSEYLIPAFPGRIVTSVELCS